MTNKILVEVFLPASNSTHDVYIPLKLKLYDVVPLLSGLLTEISNGYFIAGVDTTICDFATGKILDINMTVEDLQLKNGSKLMVI